MDENIINNYKKSLNRKFNAVCFDIDGTLTVKDARNIDSRAVEMIASLLKRKVPVVFITGRGETGLNDLVEDIYDKLINMHSLNFKDLQRMYALTNDGARLFYTEQNESKKIFNKNKYVSSYNELQQLKKFNQEITDQLKNNFLSSALNINYSTNLSTGDLINLRFVFPNTLDDKSIDLVINLISEIIKKNKFNSLTVTRGFYKDKIILQVGTAKKDIAIKRAEQIIGVPSDSMMRIGDCGDERGNDYSMLNCEQGYTVEKRSLNKNGCFPIFDDEGNILKGVDATLYIVNRAKIIPTVCLEEADKTIYKAEYAKTELNIVRGRDRHLIPYNEIINNNFNLMYGINDLFDAYSGSIKIPMYEWQIIDDNNPLKSLFGCSNNEILWYSLRDNNNYLLRGSKCYYYFLANRKSNNNTDYTSFDDVKEWYINYITFIQKCIVAINSNYIFSDIYSLKMILGILDNIRNIVILLINHNIISSYNNSNLLINLKSGEDKYINELYKILYFNDLNMSKLCFTKNCQIEKNNILKILESTFSILKYDYYQFIESGRKNIDYSKEYRAYREIDNFAENYITVMLDNEKNQNGQNNQNHCVCGICYGGIELPIIYSVINKELKDVCLLKFTKEVSGYKNKQLVDLRNFNINHYGGIRQIGQIISKNAILLDDNVLTGKTMQLAINSMYDINFNVSNINIVRYPSINRVDQMFLKNHGAIDYHLFFDYITGLCFPCPYSWRDENSTDLYLDSLGIFDLNRQKILECLAKNHDFKHTSEVAKVKMRTRQ